MNTILTFVLTYKIIKNLETNNPVNLSINLIILRTCLIFEIYVMKRERWFPILFYILFLGGILVIFLILSSVSPNEKPKKKR